MTALSALLPPQFHPLFRALLGGVSPFIVVPGDWSDADIRFQAEHVATSKLNNAGHNCIATQVLVLSEDWPLADKLIAEVGKAIREVEPRPTYYPRSDDKTDKACDGMSGTEFLSSDKSRVLIPDVDPHGGASILRDEVFAGALGVVRVPGKSARAFMRNAVEFANDVLPGTLGATIVIDPKTRKANAAAFDEAISGLRYGAIGVNVWSGLNFLLGYTPWGAFSAGDRERHRSCAERFPIATRAEERHRDPVPSVTARYHQGRVDDVAEAGLLRHEQDR